MFIIGFICWIFKAMIGLAFVAFLIGCIRLFLFGLGKSYDEPLTDISVFKKGDILLTGKQTVKHSWYIQVSNVLTRKLKHRFWTHAAIYQGEGKVC